jgi:hypothetical protein
MRGRYDDLGWSGKVCAKASEIEAASVNPNARACAAKCFMSFLIACRLDGFRPGFTDTLQPTAVFLFENLGRPSPAEFQLLLIKSAPTDP